MSASLKRLGAEGATKLLSDKMERPPFVDFVNELLDNVSTPTGVITSVALTDAYRRFGRNPRATRYLYFRFVNKRFLAMRVGEVLVLAAFCVAVAECFR